MQRLQDNLFGNVSAKHYKTIDDIHKQSVVSIKFVGDFNDRKDFSFIASDLTGMVHVFNCSDGTLRFACKVYAIFRTRLGPSYSLAPLLDFGLSDSNIAYMNAIRKADTNIYMTMQA